MIRIFSNRKFYICIFLVCFLLLYTFPVFQNQAAEYGEQSDTNKNASFSIYVNACLSCLPNIEPRFSCINNKYDNTRRYFKSRIIAMQKPAVVSYGFRRYLSMEIPYYSVQCSILGLMIVKYIFSIDGKKRINILTRIKKY